MGEQSNRVTIVDAHAMFADMLAQTLDRRGYRCHVVVATPTCSPASLMQSIIGSRPALVVVSVDLWSGREDRNAVHSALARSGRRLLAVTDGDGSEEQGEAFFRGAHAVAGKSMPLNEFVGVVRRTMAGQPVTGRQERVRMIEQYRDQQRSQHAVTARLASLSPQEGVILQHLMAGRAVREIAALRVVSEQTVRSQVKAVLCKLDVTSQIQAVALAWDGGWGLPIAHSA